MLYSFEKTPKQIFLGTKIGALGIVLSLDLTVRVIRIAHFSCGDFLIYIENLFDKFTSSHKCKLLHVKNTSILIVDLNFDRNDVLAAIFMSQYRGTKRQIVSTASVWLFNNISRRSVQNFRQVSKCEILR